MPSITPSFETFTKQLKVAHITTIDISLHFLLFNQLYSLQRAGYQVIGISSSGPYVPTLEQAGFRHIPVSMTRKNAPLADLASLWHLYRVIQHERFTIVHTHTPKPGLLGQLAAKMAGVPIIVNTLHGFYFHDYMPMHWRRFYIALEKIAACCSDIILSQNQEDIQTAFQEGICPPKKIKYLGNGIDLSEFDPDCFGELEAVKCRRGLGIASGVPVVGFVGRLAAKRKGFLDFLAAGKEVLAWLPQVRFLIIGEADVGKSDAVEPSAAADYGLEKACVFLGHRPNRELPLLYSVMDVLVLPSLFEGVPRVVMEASAMRVPVIVTDVRGNREAVEHGRNGLLVPLGDVQAMADAIADLLTNHQMARRMGEEGHCIALERFDERLVFEKVKTEYARLLREKGLPVPQPSV